MSCIKCALVSVSNKEGVVEFAKELAKHKVKIISTGGTAKALSASGIEVTEIDKVTGFPEILGGRVKTLNPKVHGALLARRNNKGHMKELQKHKIEPIDMVVANLYPFEKTISKLIPEGSPLTDDVIENIDIGGVTLLRAAAKNFEDVLVVCEPGDYPRILESIKGKKITKEFRKELASKAFRHTAYYDAVISNYFSDEKFPEKVSIGFKKMAELRYGENPHQKAAIYSHVTKSVYPGLTSAKILQGKGMSYNNYLDLEGAWNPVNEFKETACVIVKHTNPCGVACGSGKLLDIYRRALLCDSVSAFGGIVAINTTVDGETAEEIIKLFTECVIAPGYDEKAKKVFGTKKNLRVLELPTFKMDEPAPEYRQVHGGMLIQDKDRFLGTDNLKVAAKRQPSKEELESLKFAWTVAKNVKSNTITLARGKQTVGIGAGQMSRIDALKIAGMKMNEIDQSKLPTDLPLVLASDAFFPFPDVPEEAARIGVRAIIQPGGSLKDEDSIKVCNENDMAMVFTATRHFRH
jgi:phosphoribosylaminoimidazolecarboxamide formyltransferase/IMP cyclohydrolase